LSLSSAWLAPLNRGSLNSAHIHGTDVPVEEPSTASNSDLGPRLSEVRSSPNNRHAATIAACPKSANNGSDTEEVTKQKAARKRLSIQT
jgi:hypothetical protein